MVNIFFRTKVQNLGLDVKWSQDSGGAKIPPLREPEEWGRQCGYSSEGYSQQMLDRSGLSKIPTISGNST